MTSVVVDSKTPGSAVPSTTEYKHTIAIACLFRNSAFFLREWIEHHLLRGVTYFWLGNHLSTDNYLEVIQPYIDAGVVNLDQITTQISGNEPGAFEPEVHVPFFQSAVRRAKGVAKWVALLDSDEFLVPVQHMTLLEILNQPKYETYGTLLVNWQVYGTSGIYKLGENQSIMENLVCKAPAQATINTHVKSIVRPERVSYTSCDVHVIECLPPFKTAMSDGSGYTQKAYSVNGAILDEIRLNHYNTGDAHYYETEKVPFYIQYLLVSHDHKRIADIVNRTRFDHEFNSTIEDDHVTDRMLPLLKERLETGANGDKLSPKPNVYQTENPSVASVIARYSMLPPPREATSKASSFATMIQQRSIRAEQLRKCRDQYVQQKIKYRIATALTK
jgi:hypothetical protein